MKKFLSILLCAALLTLCCACSKKVDYAKLLPDTIWDNYDVGISIVFEESGVCTVSNANSMEKCTWVADGDVLTITGAVSVWDATVKDGEIYIDGMRGAFTKMRERSFYPQNDNYDYIVKKEQTETVDEDIVYDLTFWYGVYVNKTCRLSLGTAEIPNTLTYVLVTDGTQTNGTISPVADDRFILQNDDITITQTETGVMVECTSDELDVFDGAYTKENANK